MPAKKKQAKKKSAKKGTSRSTTSKKKAAKKIPLKSPQKNVATKKAKPKVAKKAAKKPRLRNNVISAGFFDTPIDVKERIITNSPFNNLEVSDLTDEQSLADNLGYQAANFVGLNISLDSYVNGRDGSLHVTSTDMVNCKTVKSTIKMVKTKVNEN